jgi:hypothetical protein
MYTLINANIHLVLQKLEKKWIKQYEWLVLNLTDCDTPSYQKQYKVFWRLNAARLDEKFCNAYFQELHKAKSNPPDLSTLILALHAIPTHGKTRQSVQCSFASKLLHMVSPSLPIYDSLIAAFYFYEVPNRKLTLQQRVTSLIDFHSFLKAEYQRILANNLLAPSLVAFRDRFKPLHFTDEKIIDSLLWGYVSLLRGGGIVGGQIQYD